MLPSENETREPRAGRPEVRVGSYEDGRPTVARWEGGTAVGRFAMHGIAVFEAVFDLVQSARNVRGWCGGVRGCWDKQSRQLRVSVSRVMSDILTGAAENERPCVEIRVPAGRTHMPGLARMLRVDEACVCGHTTDGGGTIEGSCAGRAASAGRR